MAILIDASLATGALQGAGHLNLHIGFKAGRHFISPISCSSLLPSRLTPGGLKALSTRGTSVKLHSRWPEKDNIATVLCRCDAKPQGVTFPEAQCMEDIYEVLAEKLVQVAGKVEPGKKYLVALGGPPGAGKSTVAREVMQRVNAKWRVQNGPDGADVAADVPMDGFHLYRWQLDKFEDPKEAHARRGAPWTFDPAGLVRHLAQIKEEGSGHLPSFDHGTGDPVPKDIFVGHEVKVLLVEGNYLLLDDEGWRDLFPLFNERWFIEVDLDEAMQRVEKRHVSTGKPPDVARWRVSYNDRPNAELIIRTKDNADLVIPSLPL